MCILNSHLALLHSKHTPRSVTELKDIALKTFDCKIFIDRADNKFTRFEHYGIVSCIRNRTS